MQSSVVGILGTCWATAWRRLVSLEHFLFIVLFLPSISQAATKKTTKRGEKSLLKMNYVCLPSLPQQPWQAQWSHAELVFAGCYSLHNFMIILGSSHGGMVKAHGGNSGLFALVPGPATKMLCALALHI